MILKHFLNRLLFYKNIIKQLPNTPDSLSAFRQTIEKLE